jgi:hypothetical protein
MEGMSLLRDRTLIQVNTARLSYVLPQIDPARSGLVLCGRDVEKKASTLRFEEGYTGPILIDPALYEVSVATESNPFPYEIDTGLFLNDPLRLALNNQREAGVTLPMTPTGYIRAEDSDALKAAVNRVRDLDDPNVIFAVPVDVAWLRDEESTRQLIAYLKTIECPKAIMLGGQMDPLGRYAKAVVHLRLIMGEVPDIALLRSDLAAFGALAAGASFTAFGTGARYRHIVPPNEQTQTSKPIIMSPHVLFPELMGFFLGETIAKRFAGANAPSCFCKACEGTRRLDSFTSNRGGIPAAAAAHNIAVLMEWLHSINSIEPGIARQQWWFNQCRKAIDQYDVVNTSIRQLDGFKPHEQLGRWAKIAPETAASQAQTADAESSR